MLGSSWAMVPTGVFLQELHELSISKALEKATQEAPPQIESITESPKVMKLHSDWHTPFMVYLKIGVLPEDKVDRERCVIGQDITL
jgi:hypothetical protein